MPLYEYQCDQCRKEFEALVRGNERPECPHCGGQKLTQLLSVVAAHTQHSSSLPVCSSPQPAMGCGLPQCGTGRCAMGGM